MHGSRLRSPLANVRGLGSAKRGVEHWWLQRLLSIALVPLCIWFMIVFVSTLLNASRTDVADWFASPINALLMLAFLLVLIAHSKHGLKEVIEDYVHRESMKICLLLTNVFVSLALAAAALFSIAKLHFIGI